MRFQRAEFGWSRALTLWAALAGLATAQEPTRPQTIRDLLWVWGNPEMAKPGEQKLASFTQASAAGRAKLLGVPNVLIAGQGIPNDDAQADALTCEVASAPCVIWEISADGAGGPPFDYTQRITQVKKLIDKYPNIDGVLLDDMSTVGIDHGFQPEHIRRIRQSLDGKYASTKVCGVLYTMSVDRAKIDEYVQELDVISLWVWHAKDLVNLEKYVAHCEQKYPGKPIMLGLYLYDYGDNRRMPLDLLKQQCETALNLAHARRIRGIVFLTINDDAETVPWAADWVQRVGSQKIGSSAADLKLPATESEQRPPRHRCRPFRSSPIRISPSRS